MLTTLLVTVARLAGFAAIGFILFRHPWMQKHVLRRFVGFILFALFPFYFAVRIPAGVEVAQGLTFSFAAFMFVLSPIILALGGLAGYAITRVARNVIHDRTTFIVLATMNNAGFIPLPILERIVPDEVMLGMFFFLTSFNLAFWIAMPSIIKTGTVNLKAFQFRLTPPLVGMLIGTIIAATRIFTLIPEPVARVSLQIGRLALDLALVALGASLAGIRERLVFDAEHWWFAIGRLVAFPALALGVVMLPIPGLDGPFGAAIRLTIVLQCASPPATQTMVLARRTASPDRVHHMGSLILFSYAVSLVTIPLFVSLSLLAF